MSNMGLSNRWTIHIESSFVDRYITKLDRLSKFSVHVKWQARSKLVSKQLSAVILCNRAERDTKGNLTFDPSLTGSCLTKRPLLEDTKFHVAPRLISGSQKSTLFPRVFQVVILKIEWFKTCLQTKTPTTSKILPHLLKIWFQWFDQRL